MWVTFGSEKSSKHINIRPSFEDLVAISSTEKTNYKSDKQQHFKIFGFHLVRMTLAVYLLLDACNRAHPTRHGF